MEEFNPEEYLRKNESGEEFFEYCENFLEEKSILGIDIYRYSKYPPKEQMLIPVLFDYFYDTTVKNVMTSENFFFENYAKTLEGFKKRFISTGDGGFQIFDNPMQALVFALIFQLNVKRYVSLANDNPFPKRFYKIIDSIELRYVITLDQIYKFKENFYGIGIINNARILAKDKLNRFLVDYNTIKWFSRELNSIENLIDLDIEKFRQTNFFKSYDNKLTSQLFKGEETFKSVDLLKIGQILEKETALDIFNLHIQALVELSKTKQEYNRFIITLGNLNTTGIS